MYTEEVAQEQDGTTKRGPKEMYALVYLYFV